jgi:hypothetical protein
MAMFLTTEGRELNRKQLPEIRRIRRQNEETNKKSIVPFPSAALPLLGEEVDTDVGLVNAAQPLINYLLTETKEEILTSDTPKSSYSRPKNTKKMYSSVIRAMLPLLKLFTKEIPDKVEEARRSAVSTTSNTKQPEALLSTNYFMVENAGCHLFYYCFADPESYCPGAESSCACLECIWLNILVVQQCCPTIGF